MDDTRGQLFTVEGFVAALVVLSSVIFALTVTAATPLSASTSNQHLETQQAGFENSLLDVAKANRSLRETVLYWNSSLERFHGATGDDGNYLSVTAIETGFGDMLQTAGANRSTARTVNIWYINSTTHERELQRLLYAGDPTDNAVRTTSYVTLYDDDTLVLPNRTQSGSAINESVFYAPDIDPDGHLYNVVEVEVITWRI